MTPTRDLAAKLCVLMIEDSESDAGLLRRHLEHNGFDVYAERVETEAQLRGALTRAAWDLVLCDYHVPGFEARNALATLRAIDEDVPLIVVSGVIPDEEALGLMRDGACDYVMKSNLARLAPAIRRELTEVRERQARRRAEAELVSVQQWHAAAVASSMDGYATLDGRGRILEANAAFSRLVAFSGQEVNGATLEDFVEPADAAVTKSALEEARVKGQARFECALKPSGPTQVQVALSITCHPMAKAEFFLFMHDVTDRRQREVELRAAAAQSDQARVMLLNVLESQAQAQRLVRESEERLRDILENNVSATLVLERGSVTYANPCAGEILGRAREELVGCHMLDLVTQPDRPHVAQAIAELDRTDTPRVEMSFGVLRSDGQTSEIAAVFSRTRLAGRPAILCAAQDVGERKRAQREIDSYVARLEASMQSTLQAVSGMVELRDPYTSGHERRVGDLAAAIGTEMGLAAHAVQGLKLAGYVHDIGKISIPAELLSKPGRLTPTEFELVKQHCRAGYEVLKAVDFPWPIALVILQHHERLDGSGYPQKLRGDAIALEARIVAVADVVEAMSSHRPYRPGLGLNDALAEVERGADTAYYAPAVAACLVLFRQRGYALPG